MLGALGVVYGDIGTSPLYAMRSVLGHADQVDRDSVYGLPRPQCGRADGDRRRGAVRRPRPLRARSDHPVVVRAGPSLPGPRLPGWGGVRRRAPGRGGRPVLRRGARVGHDPGAGAGDARDDHRLRGRHSRFLHGAAPGVRARPVPAPAHPAPVLGERRTDLCAGWRCEPA